MPGHLGSRSAPQGSYRASSFRPCVRAQGAAAGAGSSGKPSSPSPMLHRSTNSASSSSSSAPALCARISRFLSAAAPSSSSDLPPRMYSRALSLCREQDYERAFAVFERVVCLQPDNSKAWVSWAQAEKRATRSEKIEKENNSPAAVAVLQAGLSLNRNGPPSATAPLAQAWALLELQNGNAKAATALLARAVKEDPARCSPVLRWAPVVAAREAEEERRRRRRRSEGGGSAAAADLL